MTKVLEKEKDKNQILSTAAFGCNSDCKDKLDDFFQQKLDGSSYLFYEYFLLKPSVRDMKGQLGRMTAPFLDRLLSRMEFIPDFKNIQNIENLSKQEQIDDSVFREKLKNYEAIDFVPRTNKLLVDYWKNPRFVDHGERAYLGGKLFEQWMTFKKEGQPYGEKNKWEITFVKVNRDKVYGFGHFNLRFLKRDFLEGIANDPNLSNNDKFVALVEFLILVNPYLKVNESENLRFIVVPMASSKIFFGYVIVFYIDQKEEGKHDIRQELATLIFEVIDAKYLPVVMLFHNYWEEKELKNEIEKENNNITIGELQKRFEEEYFLFSHSGLDSSNKIESGLNRLWKNRREFLNKSTGSDGDKLELEQLKKSLIFASYMIASPGMIKQVECVIDLTSRLIRRDGALPSVIVIGGPGSGKENMAKLMHYLSNEYSFRSLHVLNMAVLRPKEVLPMLMMGAEMEMESEITDRVKKSFSVLGIFDKGLKKEETATFILDELNSLDIDSQGSLLRLIEQGELSKIGSIEKPKEVNFLIIGIMNEDPGKLTHEVHLRKLVRDKGMFGGMFGEVMYEYLRKLRRLREDLYHRIKRGGKIILPELNERRYDIPILFRVFIRQELNDNEKPIYLSYDGLDLLIDSSIEWPGNVRQLQTVARATLDEAMADQCEDQEEIRILKKHIKKALENEGSIKKPVSDIDKRET